MNSSRPALRECSETDPEVLRREVLSRAEPCVLRGLVREWPAVRAAAASPRAAVQYLAGFDSGKPVDALMTPPEIRGRIFYNADMSGFNFVRNRLPLSQLAEQVLRYAQFPQPPAVAAQSALIADCLPGFAAANPLPLLDAAVQGRIWLGNAITTPTHLDEWNNIGCVVAGRRRFTLFPPAQVANLYIGPLDFAPTGAPMSLVQLHAPDFERFSKFREALAAAVTADLSPGDAIFVPALWWHHVESLEPFNLLVNYWWHAAGGARIGGPCGFDALVLAMLNLRSLPPETLEAWRSLFEHYVFSPPEDVSGHIPQARRGILGPISDADAARVRAQLAQRADTPR